MVSHTLLLPVSPAIVLMLATIVALVSWIAFPPLFPAFSTRQAVFGIGRDLIAMVIISPTALTFGGNTNGLFWVVWRRVERLLTVGAYGFPGIHLTLRTWIGPGILSQEVAMRN